MGLLEELLDEERKGWEALRRGDGSAYYAEHLRADGIMVFPVGMLDRDSAVKGLASVPGWEEYRVEDPRAVAVGEDCAVLAYRAVARRRGEDPYRAWMCSTYARCEGRWVLVVHQQTPVPPEPG